MRVLIVGANNEQVATAIRIAVRQGETLRHVATPEAAFGRVRDNFITAASNFGEQIQYWHGLDFSVNSRMQNGLVLRSDLHRLFDRGYVTVGPHDAPSEDR